VKIRGERLNDLREEVKWLALGRVLTGNLFQKRMYLETGKWEYYWYLVRSMDSIRSL
jgi:hypothetical protein